MLLSFGPPGDLSHLGILAGDGYADIADSTPAEIARLILQRAGQALPPEPPSPAVPAPRVGNLRSRTPSFVGREGELRQLATALDAGRGGVITALHGLGGVGKTELAVAYAESQAARFQAGVWNLGAEGFVKQSV